MTIREFARAVGVSPTTVSRAMHGRGRLSPATRELVLRRASDLGFTPNLNAQRLSRGRTFLVALDFCTWHDYLSDMYFVQMARGVRGALEERGYGLLLSGPREVYDRWVRTQAVDGVILCTDQPGDTFPHRIARAGIPCVVVGQSPVGAIDGVGWVALDAQPGILQVARLLCEHGHRRIGCIRSIFAEDAVVRSFAAALRGLGVDLDEALVIEADGTSEGGARAMRHLLSQPQRPTAVFARNDEMAAGALRAARDLGLAVPRDVSVVGHDDVPMARWLDPPLTTVRVDCQRLARLATETVFSLLDGPGARPATQGAATGLIVRGTVSTPAPASSRYVPRHRFGACGSTQEGGRS